jgi:uncharacterized membrane protein
VGEDWDAVDKVAFVLAPICATEFLLAAEWVALPLMWAALVWVISAMALVECGRKFKDRALEWCGHGAAALAVTRLLILNLQRDDLWHHVSLRLITVAASCATLYVASRWHVVAEEGGAAPKKEAGDFFSRVATSAGISGIYTAASTVLAGYLLWVEATSGVVGEETFRAQCYAMTLLAGIRCGFDNFYRVSPWRFTNVRTVTVTACALLLYVLFAAAKLAKPELNPQDPGETEKRKGGEAGLRYAWRSIEAYPQHLFFFAPTILLTILVSLEVRRGFLTAAWGIEGLIVFLAVLKMDERAYRWFSLSLFMLCVARIVTVDVWNFDALGRIVSFLGLGVALLGVSFLYARHRELLRRVL